MINFPNCMKAHKNIRQSRLYGLVLAGGRSKRMKKDKSLLKYHGISQLDYCFGLLNHFCEKVFLSVRKDQAQSRGYNHLPQIHDRFSNIGPLGGILSALQKHPRAAWLVLASDLPFVDSKAVEILIQRRNPSKIATVYESPREKLPEPLCAIYEPRSRLVLRRFLKKGYRCPREILSASDIFMIRQKTQFSLANINDPAEYEQAVAILKKAKRRNR